MLFSLHPASRGWRPPEHAERHLLGALRGPGVRVLIAAFALCGLAVGAVEVGVPATLEPLGRESLTGLLLGLWGLGSLADELRRRRAPAPRATRRGGWRCCSSPGAPRTPRSRSPPARSRSASCCCSPAPRSRPCSSTPTAMLDQLAPEGTLAEAFTWTTTGLTAGMALGAALAGVLAEHASAGRGVRACSARGGLAAAALVRAAASGALRPAVAAR